MVSLPDRSLSGTGPVHSGRNQSKELPYGARQFLRFLQMYAGLLCCPHWVSDWRRACGQAYSCHVVRDCGTADPFLCVPCDGTLPVLSESQSNFTESLSGDPTEMVTEATLGETHQSIACSIQCPQIGQAREQRCEQGFRLFVALSSPHRLFLRRPFVKGELHSIRQSSYAFPRESTNERVIMAIQWALYCWPSASVDRPARLWISLDGVQTFKAPV